MSNPYFQNSAYFGKSKPQPPVPNPYGQAAPGQVPYGQASGGTSTQGYEPDFSSIEKSYYGPSAGAAQTGRMTFDDVLMKTAGVLAIVVGVAVASWFVVPVEMRFPAMIVGVLVGLVLGLVNAFKKEPSPGLIVAYAAFEGLFLGMLSGFFETMWPGIVVQAVLATFITFGVTLALFSSGKVRVTPKFTKILMIGLISYLGFCLLNLGLMLFTDVGGAFGLRSGEILGIPIGLVIGAVAVVLAAMSLVMDFDNIARGVANGVPRKFAWAAAFGITVTLIWLYVEFLRILAILRGE